MTTDWIAAAAEEIIRKAKLAAYGIANAGNELEGDYGTWDDWRELIEVELRRHYAALPPDPQDADHRRRQTGHYGRREVSLRQAAEAAFQHAVNDPMARLDQRQLKQLRAALDATDLAAELATALQDLLRYHDACGVESGTGDAARTVLRRYDDSRKEHT